MSKQIKVSNYRFFGAVPARHRHGLVTHGARKRSNSAGSQEVIRSPISSQGLTNPLNGNPYLVTLSGAMTLTFEEELDRPSMTNERGKITDTGKEHLFNILRDIDQPPIKRAQTAMFLAKSENLKSKVFIQTLVQALHHISSLLQRPTAESIQTVEISDPYTTQVIASPLSLPQQKATSFSEPFVFTLAALYHADRDSALEIIKRTSLQEKDVARHLKDRETKRLFEK